MDRSTSSATNSLAPGNEIYGKKKRREKKKERKRERKKERKKGRKEKTKIRRKKLCNNDDAA